jgi:hypothetical protein
MLGGIEWSLVCVPLNRGLGAVMYRRSDLVLEGSDNAGPEAARPAEWP